MKAWMEFVEFVFVKHSYEGSKELAAKVEAQVELRMKAKGSRLRWEAHKNSPTSVSRY